MADYDLLARHYDAVTGDSSTESAFIDSLIRQCNGPAGTLLEVACGTGGILAALAGRYQVSGLDISPGMLAVARSKLPEDLALTSLSGTVGTSPSITYLHSPPHAIADVR